MGLCLGWHIRLQDQLAGPVLQCPQKDRYNVFEVQSEAISKTAFLFHSKRRSSNLLSCRTFKTHRLNRIAICS